MQSWEIHQFCAIDSDAEVLLKMAMTRLGLFARVYDRLLKVAPTIAELARSDEIRPEHLGEAIQYRSLDRNLWMN
jgi:magnesium chelatase family protein